MEKWKIALIIFLLGALGSYGMLQKGGPVIPNPPTPEANPAVTPTPAPLVGKPMPSWNIPANYWVNSTKALTPADFKGHVTIVEFFRIECSHCQDAAPFMQNLYMQNADRGLKIVAIQAPGTSELEKDWNNVKKTVKEWQLTYPIGFDKDSTFFRTKLNGNTYPTIMVLDKNGVVRYHSTGHTQETALELESFIAQALNGNMPG
jgi:thiol-disulfide isomerase/thioredoxin